MAKTKEKDTIEIMNWKQLIELVNKTDTCNNTLIMTGWVHYYKKKGKAKTSRLFFSKIPIDIIKLWHQNHE